MQGLGLVAVFAALAAAGPGDEDVKVRARALIAQADKAYEASRYGEAADAYLEAEVLLAPIAPRPELFYNAGLAYERAGECDRVVELFARYLKAKPDKASDDLFARLEKARACAPEVVVQSAPSGAAVTIDARPRGKTPVTLNLKAGGHTIVATAEGYEKLEKAFAVEPQKPLALTIELVPLVKSGRISFDVATRAQIFVDGEKIAEGPYRGIRTVSAGQHKVLIAEKGCRALEIAIDVPPGSEPMSISSPAMCLPEEGTTVETPAPVEKEARVAPWIAAGASAAGLIAGTVFMVMSNRAADQRDELLMQPESMRPGMPIRELDDEAFAHSVGAGVSFGAAAVGVAVALVMFFGEDDE